MTRRGLSKLRRRWGALLAAWMLLPAGPALAAPMGVLRPILVAASQQERLDAGACVPVVSDELTLCLQARLHDDGRWVSAADLLAWGVSRDALVARVLRRARGHVRASGEFVEVDGLGRYWIAAKGDGWSAAALLHPDMLSRILGSEDLRVAVPNLGVVVAWAGGSAEMDLAMAVGVSDMFSAQKHPVSATVLRFDGRGWAPWATARPR
jgi:hypothetical protein